MTKRKPFLETKKGSEYHEETTNRLGQAIGALLSGYERDCGVVIDKITIEINRGNIVCDKNGEVETYNLNYILNANINQDKKFDPIRRRGIKYLTKK